MDTTDKNSAVHDEQFRKPEEGSENTNENVTSDETKSPGITTEDAQIEDSNPEVMPDPTSQSEVEKDSDLKDNSSEKEDIDTTVVEEEKNNVASEETNVEEEKENEFDEDIDYSDLNKEQLVEELSKIIASDYKPKNRDLVEEISTRFYELHEKDVEEIKQKFLESGGVIEDFKVESDPVEENLRGFVQRHRERKSAYFQKQEEFKKKNLDEKFKIIDEIESLINKEESLNQTFHEFNDLQARWKEIGLVPQQSLKEMWDRYHYTIEKFYDYIKINKELRDLDFKKNQEAKILLCEKAEELLLEPNIINAFKTLQTLHDQWREVGPVPQSMRNELWERFKEATSKINKKHQEYFHNLKDEQKKNLEQKTVLCEKAEEINEADISTLKEWDQKADELKELQKVWKTIGFAPKKDNNAIYERFRKACDAFFEKKRDFFSKNREEQNNNLQLKVELCIQAETIKDSNDWKKTTDELIALQKKWKTIGPVPRKQSDPVWKRFRAACDEFFNKKSEHFSTIDSTYEENLNKKEALIEEILSYTITDKAEEALSKLKSFQREWTEIGFVPIKKKDEIQKKFRDAINEKFDQLELDDQKKNMIKFRSKVDEMVHAPKGYSRLRQDREKLINKLKQLENDIVLWENNIGFFANSKNAQSMIHEVERKIEDAKKKIEGLHEKIRLIEDKLDD